MGSTEHARADLHPRTGPAMGPMAGVRAPAEGRSQVIGGVTGWHAPALLVVLCLFFPLVVGDTVWSADIGARLYQAKVLAETGDWGALHPFPRADPDGLYFPLHLSYATDDPLRFLTFPKHPALVWMTLGLYRIGGFPALVAVQTVATWAAALGTATFVARTRPGLAVPTLWFTGLISPLFFDAYLGYVHSVAAALLIWAAVLAVGYIEPVPVGAFGDELRLVAASLLVAGACLMRTEAAFAGVAMGFGLMITAWRRDTAIRWMIGGTAIGLTTVATTYFDRLLAPDHLALANPEHGADPFGGLVGRIEGFQQTMLSPGRSDADFLIIVLAVLVLAAGLLCRRPSQAGMAQLLLGAAVAVSLARIALGGQILVFGMIMACPLLFVGLVRGLEAIRTSAEGRFALATAVIYAGAVFATQYRFGGVAEWGGRYFAAGLPFAIVVAIPGLARFGAAFPAETARRVVALAFASAMILNLGGLWSLRQSRANTADLVDTIAASTATLRLKAATDVGGVDNGSHRPVVLTTVPVVGRVSWQEVDNGRWLLVDPDALPSVADRLHELGVRDLILVSFDVETEVEDMAARYRPVSERAPGDPDKDVVILTAVDP